MDGIVVDVGAGDGFVCGVGMGTGTRLPGVSSLDDGTLGTAGS